MVMANPLKPTDEQVTALRLQHAAAREEILDWFDRNGGEAVREVASHMRQLQQSCHPYLNILASFALYGFVGAILDKYDLD